MKLINIVAVFLFLMALGILSFVYSKQIEAHFCGEPLGKWAKGSPSERFSILIQDDIEQRVKDGTIPTEMTSLKDVQINSSSSIANLYMSKNKLKFRTHEEGKVKLEIEMFDVQDLHNPGVALQMSFIELSSGNKVFEFARTYPLILLESSQVPVVE